jgi:radical SAM protein with 4Fe4S-binding SPASM domain
MGGVAISLIITVEMGGEPLNRMLDCLAEQRLPRGVGFEVLVVDCREEPQPDSGWPFPLRWLSQSKESFGYAQRAAACNRGMTEAEGEVLVFLDEGLLVEQSFLEQHWAYHQAEKRLCVVGARLSLREGGDPETLHLAAGPEEPAVEGLTTHWLAEVLPWAMVDGANFSLRRAEMIRVGGYDADYAVYERGDVELGYRLWKMGLRILFSPAARAYRPPLPAYPKTRWRGQGWDYLHYKHPELTAWAQARQVLLGLRDHNFYTVEKAFLSQTCQAHLEASLAGDGRRGAPEPQLSLVLLVQDGGQELSRAFSYLAQSVETLPPFEVLVLDAGAVETRRQVERMTQTAQVPFALYYYPANGFAAGDGALSRRGKGTPLSQLLLEDLAAEAGEPGRRAQEQARRLSRAPFQILLDPAEVEALLAGCRATSVREGRRDGERQPWASRRRSGRRAVESGLGEWPAGSFSEGYSYPPRTVSFKLTNLCNLRCEMCGQWGPAGNVFRQEKAALQEQMGLAELRTVVDQVAAFRPGMIYIWGGEPFLHPDFLDFIAHVCRKGLYCLINTNGTRILETAQELVSIGPQYLRVSLDGPPEIHDRIRGQAGTFDKALAGIKAVDRLKREKGRLFPIIEVDCTISKSNYHCLEALLPALEGSGVHRVAYSHLVYVPQEAGESYQRLFRHLFDCEAESWRGFVQDTALIDTDLLGQKVAQLQEQENGIPVTFDPPMRSPADVTLHYRDAATLYRNRYCCAPWLWVEIHANGDVAFCDDFPDYVLGNVCQSPFLAVWNGERARRFRRELLAHRRFPVCVHCGFLHHDPTF